MFNLHGASQALSVCTPLSRCLFVYMYGQRYVLVRALCVGFLISDLIPLTSLVGNRSTAAGSRTRMLAVATTAPGLRPRDVDTRRKKVRARARIFKSDLTLPCPPPLLLQDSGVRPQDHGRGRGRYITAVVICGPGIVASGVRPQGAAAMATKVSSGVPCCIFSCSCLTLPRLLSQDAEERPQEHGRGTKRGPLGEGGVGCSVRFAGGGKGGG